MKAAEFPPMRPISTHSVRSLCESMERHGHDPRTALRCDLMDSYEDLQHAAGYLALPANVTRSEAREAVRYIERARRLINSIDIVQATALYRELADDER